jgi:hypothetical protein
MRRKREERSISRWWKAEEVPGNGCIDPFRTSLPTTTTTVYHSIVTLPTRKIISGHYWTTALRRLPTKIKILFGKDEKKPESLHM